LLGGDWFGASWPSIVTDGPEASSTGRMGNQCLVHSRRPGTIEMDAPFFEFNYSLPNMQLKMEFPIKSHEVTIA